MNNFWNLVPNRDTNDKGWSRLNEAWSNEVVGLNYLFKKNNELKKKSIFSSVSSKITPLKIKKELLLVIKKELRKQLADESTNRKTKNKNVLVAKNQIFGIEVPAPLGYSQQRAGKEPMNASE